MLCLPLQEEVEDQAFPIMEWDFASKLTWISLKHSESYLLVYVADGLPVCCFASGHWMGRELP